MNANMGAIEFEISRLQKANADLHTQLENMQHYIGMSWIGYALAEDSTLAPDALRLKGALLKIADDSQLHEIKSLYAQLQREREGREKLREALEFYADAAEWELVNDEFYPGFVALPDDAGQRARAALAQTEVTP